MRLNAATRHFHADVDEPWLDLVRPNIGVSDYLAVLVRTYGLVAPFESACRYTPGLVRVIDFRHMMRAGLIAQDLLALGLSPQQVASIPTCSAVSMFQTTSEALGWLYVIERSTLLQDGIRKHLLRHVNIEHACSYVSAYESRVGEHWAAFSRTLERAVADASAANDIIHSACTAFDACRKWLRSSKLQTRNVG